MKLSLTTLLFAILSHVLTHLCLEIRYMVDLYLVENYMIFYVFFQLRRIKNADATISGELTPYNIVPLEAPSFTNAIGLFPEVSLNL